MDVGWEICCVQSVVALFVFHVVLSTQLLISLCLGKVPTLYNNWVYSCFNKRKQWKKMIEKIECGLKLLRTCANRGLSRVAGASVHLFLVYSFVWFAKLWSGHSTSAGLENTVTVTANIYTWTPRMANKLPCSESNLNHFFVVVVVSRNDGISRLPDLEV